MLSLHSEQETLQERNFFFDIKANWKSHNIKDWNTVHSFVSQCNVIVNSDLFRNKNYSTFAQIKNKIVFVQLMITFSSYNCLYFSLIFKDVIIRILWNQYVLVMVGLQDCYLFLILNILGYVLGSCCHLATGNKQKWS